MRSEIACVALLGLFALSGCGRMPSISSALPNWPTSASDTPEETRRKREAEMAIYMTRKPEPPQPAAAPPAQARAATSSSVAPSVPPPAAAGSPSSRKFEVAPELIANAPPRLGARDTAAPAAAVAPVAAAGSARYGDLLFISGQLPVDARGNPTPVDARFEDQARLTMENVRSVLESNRLSMANVVSMTVYLRDLNDIRAFDTLFASYFKGPQPARSIVEVSRLPSNARIEISAVAGR